MLVVNTVLSLILVAPTPVSRFLEVDATFVPPPSGRSEASVEILFTPLDPDVRVNEQPAVKLLLDPDQVVLALRTKPAPPSHEDRDLSAQRYLDLTQPVRVPVELAPKAPRGTWDLGATVTYFFCSVREGWCRKGTSEVRLVVRVP